MRTTPKYLAATAALVMAALTVLARGTPAENASGPSLSVTSADDNASPIYGVTIPAGYRQWQLIAPSHEAILDELRHHARERRVRNDDDLTARPEGRHTQAAAGRIEYRPALLAMG